MNMCKTKKRALYLAIHLLYYYIMYNKSFSTLQYAIIIIIISCVAVCCSFQCGIVCVFVSMVVPFFVLSIAEKIDCAMESWVLCVEAVIEVTNVRLDFSL